MKLIVFDWDQTLWNSWDIHVMAAGHAADVLNLPRPKDERIAATFSVPFDQHMEMLFHNNTQKATAHYLEFYHSRVGELGGLFNGVPEMLTALRDSGYLLALLSDKRRVYGSVELQSVRIADLFDHTEFLDDDRAYKPDPQGLQQVMNALSVCNERVLYVGDSYVDVQCARRTGVASGGALWGSVNAKALLGERPDYVWNSVADVSAALAPDSTAS